jgi:hypothetical protein
MGASTPAESTARTDMGSLGGAPQATAPTPAEPTTDTSLAKTPPPTFVGSGKAAKFTFTETADEPSVHVTAEEAAHLEDNSLLTCLKKQHRKTIEEREAFLVYFAETVRRFSRPRLRDGDGKFVSDGKPTLPEAFTAIGLSFDAEQKRSERYRKQLRELAELAAPVLTDGSEESPNFSLGEEVSFAGADSAATYYVVGKDQKSNGYDLVSSDGKEEKKRVAREQLAPLGRPTAHRLKEGDRYVDTATRREFVYDGNGGLKRIVLPKAVQQLLQEAMDRDLERAKSRAAEGVPTAQQKAAQNSRRNKENEERDKANILSNEAERQAEEQKKANRSKRIKTTESDNRTSPAIKAKAFVTKRLENPRDGYLFGTFSTDDLNTPLSVYRSLQDAEAETARLKEKCAVKILPGEPPVDELSSRAEAPLVEHHLVLQDARTALRY